MGTSACAIFRPSLPGKLCPRGHRRWGDAQGSAAPSRDTARAQARAGLTQDSCSRADFAKGWGCCCVIDACQTRAKANICEAADERHPAGREAPGSPSGTLLLLQPAGHCVLWDGLGQGLLELLCWCHGAATAWDSAGRACKDSHGLPKTPNQGLGILPEIRDRDLHEAGASLQTHTG